MIRAIFEEVKIHIFLINLSSTQLDANIDHICIYLNQECVLFAVQKVFAQESIDIQIRELLFLHVMQT